MKKTADIAIAAVFLGFLAAAFTLRLCLPARDFSERENRYLQQRPAFSFAALFSGDYTSRFESYTTDQFPFRDAWTTLKARCEILSGKRENNGVYYCGDGVLITRFDAPDDDFLRENACFVRTLSENVDVPVYFSLIPGAAEIQNSRLPDNAPTDSQRDVIDTAYAESGAITVDMLSALSEHSGEYIFYRTDHHWTTLGAFYGYNALRGSLALSPADLGSYSRETVSESFYGTSYSSSGFSWVPPDSIEVFVPNGNSVTVTNYNTGAPVVTPLYDESFLSVKDKYAFFLGGNSPRISIDTGATDKPRICILRDSYADSFVPFLLEDFSQIDMLDLRYYKESVSSYIRDGDFDIVLVMYSVANFCTDSNLFMLGT